MRGAFLCACLVPGVVQAMYHRAVGRNDGPAFHDVSFSDDATQDNKDKALMQGARDNILEMV